jgi:hypothetical protein
MKKLAAVTTLSLLAVLIVLLGACSVNYVASNSFIADGAPLPWPFSLGAQTTDTPLIADGAPLPWPFSTQSSQLA